MASDEKIINILALLHVKLKLSGSFVYYLKCFDIKTVIRDHYY